jgi:hypothetical protein
MTRRSRLPLWFAVMGMLTGPLLASAAESPDTPFKSDEHTMALLHLDGSANDAGPKKVNVEIRGPLNWTAGPFGKAAHFDGTCGIVLDANAALCPGDQSWTVECRIKPDAKEPDRAVLISGGYGFRRIYFFQLDHRRRLSFSFSASPHTDRSVHSGDLSHILFDGQWHHVAAVVDRSRRGELRLYLDGRDVTANQAAQPFGLHMQDGRMAATVGAVAPWYLGDAKTASAPEYQGAIDEVRISNIVRPDFQAKPGSPLPVVMQAPPPVREAAQTPDDPASESPVVLTPDKTLIVRPEFSLTSDVEAARTLQNALRKAYGVKRGFDMVTDWEMDKRAGRFVIAVGRTRWVSQGELDAIRPNGFILRRKGNALVIAGPNAEASMLGIERFLKQCVGIRAHPSSDHPVPPAGAIPMTIKHLNLTVQP